MMPHLTHKQKEAVFNTLSSFLNTASLRLDSNPDWKTVSGMLHDTGLPSDVIDAFIFWGSNRLDELNKRSVPNRVLHEMEKELISKDAYGQMLTAIRLGFVEVPQTEFLLEEMAVREHLPISANAMKRTLIKHWYNTLVESGVLRSQ